VNIAENGRLIFEHLEQAITDEYRVRADSVPETSSGLLRTLALSQNPRSQQGALLVVSIAEAVSLASLSLRQRQISSAMEAQSLALPLGFGGPTAAAGKRSEKFVRHCLAVSGTDHDKDGNRGFVLTLPHASSTSGAEGDLQHLYKPGPCSSDGDIFRLSTARGVRE